MKVRTRRIDTIDININIFGTNEMIIESLSGCIDFNNQQNIIDKLIGQRLAISRLINKLAGVQLVGQFYPFSYSKIKNIRLKNDIIDVPVELKHDIDQRELLISKFILKQCNVYLPQMINSICQSMNISNPIMSIDAVLNEESSWFNLVNHQVGYYYKIIQLPADVIKYLCLHSILQYNSFNPCEPEFWQIFSKIIPDFTAIESRLSQYNYLIETI